MTENKIGLCALITMVIAIVCFFLTSVNGAFLWGHFILDLMAFIMGIISTKHKPRLLGIIALALSVLFFPLAAIVIIL